MGKFEEIEARLGEAEPWEHPETRIGAPAGVSEFVAHAREDVRWLLERIRELEDCLITKA